MDTEKDIRKTKKEPIQYDRDFLLKFENVFNRPDPKICAMLAPFLTVSQPSTPNPNSKNKKGNWNKSPGGPKTPNEKTKSPFQKSKDPFVPGQKEVTLTSNSREKTNETPTKSKFLSFFQDQDLNSLNPNLVTPPTSPRSPPVSPRSPPVSPRSPPVSPRSPPATSLSPPVSPRSYPTTPTHYSSPNMKLFSTPSQQTYPSTPTHSNTPSYKNPPSSKKNTPYPKSPRNTNVSTGNTSMSVSGPPVIQSSKSPQSPIPRPRVARPISPLDDFRLMQRQKQLDYGKRTVGYLRYRLFVPKDKRKPEHPRTPKKTQGCSKRSWDGQLKKWRRDLHLWDPENMSAFKALLESDLVETIITTNPDLAEIVSVIKEKLNDASFDINKILDEEDNEKHDDENEESSGDDENNEEEEEEKDNRSGDVVNTNETTTHSKVARTLVFV